MHCEKISVDSILWPDTEYLPWFLVFLVSGHIVLSSKICDLHGGFFYDL